MSPRQLLKRLKLEPDSAVLEVGSGPGYYSVETAKAVPRGRLILLDVQQEMLDMARRRVDDSGVVGSGSASVEYLRADAAAIPLEDGSADVAFLVGVLGEVPEPHAVLCEIRRVLRPGGRLSLTEWMAGNPHSISDTDLQKIAEEAGFRMLARRGRWFSRTLDFRV